MLLNSDIKKEIVLMILHFRKEINVIMYIIENKFKFNFNHFIWTKFQWDMNFQIMLLLCLKWNIWQIKCNVTHYHNKCGGLIAKVFACI